MKRVGRGACETVTEQRNRVVNGEPRDTASRGSFISGQLWQGFTTGQPGHWFVVSSADRYQDANQKKGDAVSVLT